MNERAKADKRRIDERPAVDRRSADFIGGSRA